MSKDKAMGGAILALCVIVAVGYLALVCVPSFLGLGATATRLDAVLILVSVVFIAILGIGGWIGYTMATTAPPKPIEEIATETKTENKTPQYNIYFLSIRNPLFKRVFIRYFNNWSLGEIGYALERKPQGFR